MSQNSSKVNIFFREKTKGSSFSSIFCILSDRLVPQKTNYVTKIHHIIIKSVVTVALPAGITGRMGRQERKKRRQRAPLAGEMVEWEKRFWRRFAIERWISWTAVLVRSISVRSLNGTKDLSHATTYEKNKDSINKIIFTFYNLWRKTSI